MTQGMPPVLESDQRVAEDGVRSVLDALQELLLVVIKINFEERLRRVELLHGFIEFRYSILLLVQTVDVSSIFLKNDLF